VHQLIYFTAGYPPSRCKVDPYDNKTAFPNLTNQLITELFIPWNSAQQVYSVVMLTVFV